MTTHKHFTNPTDQRPGPNCGVTATAICAGVSFQRAWNTWKTLGVAYYTSPRWKGTTGTHHQGKALEKLGIEYQNYTGSNCDAIDKTLTSFCNEWVDEGELWMVTTTCHVQSVTRHGGKVYVIDQQGKKEIGDYWGKRKRVKNVKRIKTPYKNAIEREQVIEAQKTNTATIPTQSHDTLFPSLFEDKRKTAHSSAQQLTLF